MYVFRKRSTVVKNKKEDVRYFNRRVAFLLICKSIVFALLGINFYKLQILSRDKYKLLSDKNRIRVNIIEALRGIITDRNSKVLATNAFTYNLSADTNQNLQLIADELKEVCNINLSKIDKKYQSQVTLCTGLTWNQIVKIESNMRINSIIKIDQ